MKNIYDVLSVIPQFYAYVKTQFNAEIRAFRSDNAPKLDFTEFFKDKGVIHQFSCVGRVEQNYVVECKHQHLLNVSRSHVCLLFFEGMCSYCSLFDNLITLFFSPIANTLLSIRQHQ